MSDAELQAQNAARIDELADLMRQFVVQRVEIDRARAQELAAMAENIARLVAMTGFLLAAVERFGKSAAAND